MKDELRIIRNRLYMLQLDEDNNAMDEMDHGKSNGMSDNVQNLENAITEIDHILERI